MDMCDCGELLVVCSSCYNHEGHEVPLSASTSSSSSKSKFTTTNSSASGATSSNPAATAPVNGKSTPTSLNSHTNSSHAPSHTSTSSSSKKQHVVSVHVTPDAIRAAVAATHHEAKYIDPPRLINSILSFVGSTNLPTQRGKFYVRAYRDKSNNTEPLVMVTGDIGSGERIPVRVHDQCFTSEVFGSLKCDCKEQLNFAMEYIQENSPGIVIYLHQEGRGIGLANKIRAYALQEKGFDTVDANLELGFEVDLRQYACVPVILEDCGVKSIQLLTNNPRKLERLRDLNIEITDRIPIIVPSNPHSQSYLVTKEKRMGHLFGESYQENLETKALRKTANGTIDS